MRSLFPRLFSWYSRRGVFAVKLLFWDQEQRNGSMEGYDQFLRNVRIGSSVTIIRDDTRDG